jgi:hypothetical protein
MNLSRKKVAEIKAQYTAGTCVEMILMKAGSGALANLPVVAPGTRGTVTSVDDAGQIHVAWASGSSLAIIVDEDQFKEVTPYEIRVEQLESLGMTTSDAQGVADVEEMRDTLQENIDAHLMEYGTDAENGMAG